MHAAPEILFAQKLAANEKRIRDRAVKKLKKWLVARSSSIKYHLTEEELLKLWKGLFYCMWMSDKPLVQEELAKTISEIILCFNKKDAALLFIKEFFETMNREWPRIDYLRMDKFMMFVRRFLNQSFEFLRKLSWDEEAKGRLLDILNETVINPKTDDACLGFQLHIADIYIEELVKVADGELSGKQLTRFLVPYCHLLATSRSPVIRKTVIQRVFEFTMRLSDDDDDSVDDSEDDGKPRNEGLETSNTHSQAAEDTDGSEDFEDDEMVGSDIDEDDEEEGRDRIYGEFQGERAFLHKVKKREIENLKLPIPEFDYQDIGNRLFEIISKSQMKQKFRNENYSLVKKFHEMAKGIFPLDLVDTSLGRRLSKKDIEAAARRLLAEREEEMRENSSSKRLKRKRKVHDEDSDAVETQPSGKNKNVSPKCKKHDESGPDYEDETAKLESPDKKRAKRPEQKKAAKRSRFLTKKKMNQRKNATKTKSESEKQSNSTNCSLISDQVMEDVHSEQIINPGATSAKNIKKDETGSVKCEEITKTLPALNSKAARQKRKKEIAEDSTLDRTGVSVKEIDHHHADATTNVENQDKKGVEPTLVQDCTPTKSVDKGETSSESIKCDEIAKTSPALLRKSVRLKRKKQTLEDSAMERAKLSSKASKKNAKNRVTGNDFVKFEEFVKTPPAFFRKAVCKVTPKTLPTPKKGTQDKEDSAKSLKKVNFRLTNNSAHGTQDYAFSVKKSPGIPYDANKQPTQSVLKLKTAALQTDQLSKI